MARIEAAPPLLSPTGLGDERGQGVRKYRSELPAVSHAPEVQELEVQEVHHPYPRVGTDMGLLPPLGDHRASLPTHWRGVGVRTVEVSLVRVLG